MSNSVQITGENAAELLDLAAKAQAEADSKGAPPAEKAPETPAAESKELPKDEQKPTGLEIEKPAEEPNKAPEAEAIDLDAVTAEYETNGALSEETNAKLVKALEGAGFKNAQATIEQFIAGRQASVASQRAAAFDIVGGESNYTEMAAWAKANVPADELAAYNEAVTNPKAMKLAVAGLFAQYQAATKAAPANGVNRVRAGANTTGAGFEPVYNDYQVSQITADPRFDRDPAWRAQQEARIKASMDAGILK